MVTTPPVRNTSKKRNYTIMYRLHRNRPCRPSATSRPPKYIKRNYRLSISLLVIVFMLLLMGSAVFFGTATFGTTLIRWVNDAFAPPQGVCQQISGNVHVLLVDSSDPVTTEQQDEIDSLVEEDFLKKSHAGDRVVVAQLVHDMQSPVDILFKGCDVGQRDDVSMLFHHPDRIAEIRKNELIEPFIAAARKAQLPRQPATHTAS